MGFEREAGIVEALYDAALGRELWEEVAKRLSAYMGGTIVMLSTHAARSAVVDIVGTHALTPEHLRQYGHFAPHDLWVQGYMAHGLDGKARTGSSMVDDRVLLKSYIYNDYLRPQLDSRYVVGSVLPLAGGHTAVVGIHRPHGAKEYSRRETDRLNGLMPHIQRSLEMRRRLQAVEQHKRAAEHALDQLTVGVLLLAADGRLLYANGAGEAILRSADGLSRSPEGVRASNKEDDKRLQQLIEGLRKGSKDTPLSGGHLGVRRRSGQPSYAVMVAPAGASLARAAKSSPAVLVFISDPAAKVATDWKVLADLFGFTPAECRLVLALMQGIQLPDYAQQSGISYNTVRTLLARAMARVECRSQVELVLLVSQALAGVSHLASRQ